MLFPRQPMPTINPISSIHINTNAPTPTNGSPFPSQISDTPGGAISSLIVDPTDSTSTPTRTTSQTSSATTSNAASTSTSAASGTNSGLPMTTEVIAIIVPIAVVVILIPILYMLWVRYRTRNMKKLESEPRYSPSPSKEPKFGQHSPRNSPKQSFLPPLFHERAPTKEGSLFDEVRVSMESARRNESVGLFDRTRDDLGTKESSYNVYALRRSLEDKGRTNSIGLFDLPRKNSERSSPSMQPQRGPSPTLPSPKVPLFDRPPSEAWPLPANKLPSPQLPYDPHLNTNKPLPPHSSSNIPPPNMAPGSRQESQTNSYASSNVLPLQHPQDYRPSSSGRSQMNSGQGNQQRFAGCQDPASRYASPVQPTFSPAGAGEHNRGRQRDSDLVSELSYRSPSHERDPKRRSTDAISVVSAISNRKRRSERDVDAMSVISALSPDQDVTPRIPMEHYPR